MSQRQVEDFEVEQEQKKSPPQVVNKKGEYIKLTDRQKNEIYHKAKKLQGQVKDKLCTRNECWSPTDSNVRKMGLEMKNAPTVQLFKKHMQAIGADPKDYSTERMRR